jgi:hypothetical protein
MMISFALWTLRQLSLLKFISNKSRRMNLLWLTIHKREKGEIHTEI